MDLCIDAYDDRLARGHVFRLRELLSQTPAAYRSDNPSVFSLLANPKVRPLPSLLLAPLAGEMMKQRKLLVRVSEFQYVYNYVNV